jgi:transcriptional regulator with XRE-family HTH domain
VRRKRKTREEVLQARHEIQRRAAAGQLVFPSAIREIRIALDLTQEEFAKAFRLTRQQVVALESGNANPTIDTLERIMRPFRLTIGLVPKTTDDVDPTSPAP